MEPNQSNTPPVQPAAPPPLTSPNQAPPSNLPTDIKYVGFGRLPALIVDGILASIIGAPIAILLGYNFAHDDPMNFMTGVINLVSIIYYIIFDIKFGATPGKMLFKMRVVDTKYVKPSLGRIILRESIGKWISYLLFPLAVLCVIFDKKKRGIHDFIASTYVIYKK